MAIERPLDASAHIRIEGAVVCSITHAGPLYVRVQLAHSLLAPILFERFDPEITDLLRALDLGEADGVKYIPQLGLHFEGVHWRKLKQWLTNLMKLYALSCHLRGRDPDLESWLSG